MVELSLLHRTARPGITLSSLLPCLFLTINFLRRDHRKIAMQVLNTNAVSDRSPLMEFEAWDLVHGIFMATQGGTTPVDPVHFIGKYALKFVINLLWFLNLLICAHVAICYRSLLDSERDWKTRWSSKRWPLRWNSWN